MNLWIRLAWLFVTSRFRASVALPYGTSRLGLAVLPNDVDMNLHMNNGRYLTVMDLGCIDLILNGPLRGPVLANRWLPVIRSTNVQYVRPLKPFQRYRLDTRIVYWERQTVVIEQRFVTTHAGREKLAAVALVRGGLYSSATKGFVPVAQAFLAAGVETEEPEMSEAVSVFLGADKKVRATA